MNKNGQFYWVDVQEFAIQTSSTNPSPKPANIIALLFSVSILGQFNSLVVIRPISSPIVQQERITLEIPAMSHVCVSGAVWLSADVFLYAPGCISSYGKQQLKHMLYT